MPFDLDSRVESLSRERTAIQYALPVNAIRRQRQPSLQWNQLSSIRELRAVGAADMYTALVGTRVFGILQFARQFSLSFDCMHTHDEESWIKFSGDGCWSCSPIPARTRSILSIMLYFFFLMRIAQENVKCEEEEEEEEEESRILKAQYQVNIQQGRERPCGSTAVQEWKNNDREISFY